MQIFLFANIIHRNVLEVKSLVLFANIVYILILIKILRIYHFILALEQKEQKAMITSS